MNKFKFWNTISNRFESSDNYVMDSAGVVFSTNDPDFALWHEENIIAVASTGLLDKNGAEIYEGDIIKTTALFNNCNQKGAIDYFTVISFMGNYCLAKYGHDAGTPIYPTCLKSSIEVIGNTRENPELPK
ncbi:YopX family protein [uncultured Alteromonas sp.]|uniref:YopX family protein n=1 Tax=uncultured Alteromonas sp. TaxID=179113 RepID=UPI0030ECDC50|tara:strand:- start:2164 stop:2553 length:390 start_codon:yes stop_codon:yes gene_type:complete